MEDELQGALCFEILKKYFDVHKYFERKSRCSQCCILQTCGILCIQGYTKLTKVWIRHQSRALCMFSKVWLCQI
jgi:hypothetical protein